jgi:hypothetical protein
MKVRRIIILTLALSVICGGALYADSIAQQLRVWFNKQEVDSAGLFIDDKAYVSVASISDKMNMMSTWDPTRKTMAIYTPNVHMFTMHDSLPFGTVQKEKVNFFVFSQIDSLKTEISAFRVTIMDPYGDDTILDGRSSEDEGFPKGLDSFSFKSKEVSYDFKHSGKYTVRFWMKPAGETLMQVVSQKIITVQ